MSNIWGAIHTRSKLRGFYVWLLTRCKNECKQWQKGKSKGYKILKIKTIFYRHHLPFYKNESSAHHATWLSLWSTLL